MQHVVHELTSYAQWVGHREMRGHLQAWTSRAPLVADAPADSETVAVAGAVYRLTINIDVGHSRAIRSGRHPNRCDSNPHSSATPITTRSYPLDSRSTAATGELSSSTLNSTGTGWLASWKTRSTMFFASSDRTFAVRIGGTTCSTVTAAPLFRPMRLASSMASRSCRLPRYGTRTR